MKSSDPGYMKEYYLKNKDRLNQQSKKYYQENKERLLLLQKDFARKRLYGLTPTEYDYLVTMQDNRCAVCNQEFIKTPHVDHCHTTGRIRGLLCQSCNTTLGKYEKYKQQFDTYLNEGAFELK